MLRFLFAVDSLKGTLSSPEAEAVLAAAAERSFPGCSCVSIPIADGGEGTVDAILASQPAAQARTSLVQDPLGSSVKARWALLPDGRAIIEMAQAAGLTLVPEALRDPARTTTYGVGQLVLAALDAGARDITLAIGGSATNDGGIGLLEALGWRFLDASGRALEPVGASLGSIATIDATGADPRLASARFQVMCDVENPLCGPSGCAAVFGPQKGATPAQVSELDRAMASFAQVTAEHAGRDLSLRSGAGAAGGLGFATQVFLDADFVLGIDALLDLVDFDQLLSMADLVVTGEGRLDDQTAAGKVVAGVAARAAAHHVPCVAVCGAVEPDVRIPGLDAAFSSVTALVPSADHLARAHEAYQEAAERLFSALAIGAAL